MKTATYIRDIDGWRGDARFYGLSEPMRYDIPWDDDDPPAKETNFVIVSAAYAMGPETYIFPADADGEVLDWGELDGSFQGGLSHSKALRNAGYEVITE